MAITEEEVRYGFRFVLGRAPGEGDVVSRRAKSEPDFEHFRQTLLTSAEFAAKYVPRRKSGTIDPVVYQDEPCIVFLHVAKAAGTTLRSVVQRLFPDSRACPDRFNTLHARSAEELAPYDLYCGHFDFGSFKYIPRKNLTLLTMLREPRARTLSQYYFLRSHDEEASEWAELANRYPVEEFFELPAVRTGFLFSDPMTRMLFGAWPLGDHKLISRPKRPAQSRFELDPPAALRVAMERLEQFVFVGIQEQFDRSIDLLCHVLAKPKPADIKPLNVLRNRMGTSLRNVETQPTTPRLLAAIDSLTALDRELYSHALALFEAQCKTANLPPPMNRAN